jgi:hypothetical protein
MGWASAVGNVIGAGIGLLGTKSAESAQEKSTDKALAYQQQQDATRKAEYDKAMAAYQQRVQYQDALRSSLLSRLGFDTSSLPSAGASAPAPAGGPVSIPGGAPGAVPRALPPGGPMQAPAPAAPQPGGPMQPGGRVLDLIRGADPSSPWTVDTHGLGVY